MTWLRLISCVTLLLAGLETASGRNAATPAAMVQPFVERHEVAGAVLLVADKAKVLSLEAVGYADIANSRP